MTDVSTPTFQIAAFYYFGPVPSESIENLGAALEEAGRERGLKGLVIFATEGINGTICGRDRSVASDWLKFASGLLRFPDFQPKWSEAPAEPFRRFGVRIRDEIVTLGKPEIQPLNPGSPTHLSPDQWDEMMAKEDVVVLDTRNWYETRIGTFKNAVDPEIDEFSDFGRFVNEKSAAGELPKDKKILIFCTGGIRCEKAIVEMHHSGFENVYQLDGGILNYLAQKPNKNFEGECFVFDHRVAVDQAMQPSVTYTLCPHCGQPADQAIACNRCDEPAKICVTCQAKEAALQTCSKNCANHFRAQPGRKGKSQGRTYRFQPTSAVRPVTPKTQL